MTSKLGPMHRQQIGRGFAIIAVGLVATLGLTSCRTEPASLTVTTVTSGIGRPWDLAFTPGGSMLFTERAGKIRIRLTSGATRTLAEPADVVAASEGGMLGIAVDPNFSTNRRIYTCFMSDLGGAADVRLVRWRVNNAVTALGIRADIVTGIPVNQSGQLGRHSGCRPRFGPDGRIWVGTGDAAIGSVPQTQLRWAGRCCASTRMGTASAGMPLRPSTRGSTPMGTAMCRALPSARVARHIPSSTAPVEMMR